MILLFENRIDFSALLRITNELNIDLIVLETLTWKFMCCTIIYL